MRAAIPVLVVAAGCLLSMCGQAGEPAVPRPTAPPAPAEAASPTPPPTGASPSPAPTELPSADRIATRVAEERAVAATLTAVAGARPAGTQPALPEPTSPPPTPIGEAPPPTPPPPTLPPPAEEPVAYQGVPPEGNLLPDSEVTDNNSAAVGVIRGSLQIADVKGEREGRPLVRGRLAIRIAARLERPGEPAPDGAGIAHVLIVIKRYDGGNPGTEVHQREERNAAYCAFGGGEPDCNVWVFAEHGNQWPNGTPLESGWYWVSAEIVLKDQLNVSNRPFWFTNFYLEAS
jgi:hypothetical protein